MGNSVPSISGPNGERLIGVDEAQALLGPLWPSYETEFAELQPPVELKVFASHATKVLNSLVQTGKVSLALDMIESGHTVYVDGAAGKPSKVKSRNMSINIKGFPVDVPARTIKKKKRKEKKAEKRREKLEVRGQGVPKTVKASVASKELFPSDPEDKEQEAYQRPPSQEPLSEPVHQESRAERRMSISAEQGADNPEQYLSHLKSKTNATFDNADYLQTANLRSNYLQADDDTQEDLMEDFLDEVDKICSFCSFHGIEPGDILLDKNGVWDGEPENLVHDLVRLGWDLVQFADMIVDMDETNEEWEDYSKHNIETLYTFGLRCFSIARALAYKENANILCGIGMTLSDLGKAHDGFKVLDLSIKIDPANHITMLYRGIIHYDLGRLREASSELELAISQCAKANDAFHLEEALRKRGNVLEDLGNFRAAAANYALGMELVPDDPIFVSARALCLMKLRLFTKAGVLFFQASKMYHEEEDEEAAHHCLKEVNRCKSLMVERKEKRESSSSPEQKPMRPTIMKQMTNEAKKRLEERKKEGMPYDHKMGVKMFEMFDRDNEDGKPGGDEKEQVKQRPKGIMSQEEMKNKLAEAEARVAKHKEGGMGYDRKKGVKMFGAFDHRKTEIKPVPKPRMEKGPSMTQAEMKSKLAEAEARVATQKAEGGGSRKGVKMFNL